MKVVNNLIVLEAHAARDVILALVFIAGCGHAKAGCELTDDSFFHCDNYESYLAALDRGGLMYPTDSRSPKSSEEAKLRAVKLS